ncbi:SIR2 family NAD-dependent protein deacylase [Galbibacter mesophilus]|uniref:SIR2 family NAD-dependent protein deacylase n=1 Tax=Galbibacter mesophilus TaxID=379069 RepID=UPI00191F47E0|nr:NAD-dependent deacylase [Galbibacter mesophilus]MCM5664131.1 NAD-dependent deacylase [Galbibacter mesophilus]
MRKIVVLTGAGVSAESGLKTFRDADGLWEGHDVMEVASLKGWEYNPELVLEFYNERRRQLQEVTPNDAHFALAELEKDYDVTIITQNVDDLHERAGSTHVIHLHGELLKARSSFDEDLVFDWKEDIKLGDLCEHHSQIRPHIVWFGEAVPLINVAAEKVAKADIVMVVGTSMQVYPAAGLVDYKPYEAPLYFIDPRPSISENAIDGLEIIAEKASVGVPIAVSRLLDN